MIESGLLVSINDTPDGFSLSDPCAMPQIVSFFNLRLRPVLSRFTPFCLEEYARFHQGDRASEARPTQQEVQ